jgi:uncharacterized membrane protein YphA (DoxX/SURF4 family)/peroxiredoxin
MKFIINLVRHLVGILFVFSGFVKLIDPLGFSYKLKEYFSEAVLDIPFLQPYTLLLSIFVVIFEILVGIALIIGFKIKFTRWLLLLMILFFTFLTFYSAYFNKVTDCGCFGDAISLTPWQSFTKDIILLVLILIIFLNPKKIKPFTSVSSHKWILSVSLILCLYITYDALTHLPMIDFRPYHIGANIKEGMKIPEDAPQAVYKYKWQFNIDGQKKTITTNGQYPDVNGEFIEVNTELIKPGYQPPIHDFSLNKKGEDYTDEYLNADRVMLICAYNLDLSNKTPWRKIGQMAENAKEKGYKVAAITASSEARQNQLKENYNLDFPFYFTDETAIKTIIRSNPGVLIIADAVITQKVHWNDLNLIEL